MCLLIHTVWVSFIGCVVQVSDYRHLIFFKEKSKKLCCTSESSQILSCLWLQAASGDFLISDWGFNSGVHFQEGWDTRVFQTSKLQLRHKLFIHAHSLYSNVTILNIQTLSTVFMRGLVQAQNSLLSFEYNYKLKTSSDLHRKSHCCSYCHFLLIETLVYVYSPSKLCHFGSYEEVIWFETYKLIMSMVWGHVQSQYEAEFSYTLINTLLVSLFLSLMTCTLTHTYTHISNLTNLWIFLLIHASPPGNATGLSPLSFC